MGENCPTFLSKSLFFGLLESCRGRQKLYRNRLFLLHLFHFGTKRGIAPITQISFARSIRKQGMADDDPIRAFPFAAQT
jgi:hypothetical protein